MASTRQALLQEKLTPEQWLELLPREADLPSQGTKMESSIHALQLRLLITILEWHWRDRLNFFIGDNLTIYFSYEQTKRQDFRGPDFFVVTDVDPRHRKSWVVWEEGRLPELIIELLSDSTAETDRVLKKALYEKRLHTTEYFWFAPETGEFAGFHLRDGKYEPIEPDERGWRWSKVLNLYMGAHEGLLRYYAPDGQMLPTPDEVAEEQMQRAQTAIQQARVATQQEKIALQQAAAAIEQAESATERAEAETERAAHLAAKLRELGIDPNSI